MARIFYRARPLRRRRRAPVALFGLTPSLIVASVSQTLDSVTQSSAAKIELRAQSASAVSDVAQSSFGKLLAKSASTQTLDAVASSASGKLIISASSSQTLDAVVGSESSIIIIKAAVTQVLDGVTQHAVGLPAFFEITDTAKLQKPIDYALAGEQLIKDRYRTWEIPPQRKSERRHTMKSGVQRIGGAKPSYTTRSGSLGSSHK